jgi:hypothetical protein
MSSICEWQSKIFIANHPKLAGDTSNIENSIQIDADIQGSTMRNLDQYTIMPKLKRKIRPHNKSQN